MALLHFIGFFTTSKLFNFLLICLVEKDEDLLMPDLSMQKPLLAFWLLKLLIVYDEYTRHEKKAVTICYLNTNFNENRNICKF